MCHPESLKSYMMKLIIHFFLILNFFYSFEVQSAGNSSAKCISIFQNIGRSPEAVGNVSRIKKTAEVENDYSWDKNYKESISPRYHVDWNARSKQYGENYQDEIKNRTDELKMLEEFGFEFVDGFKAPNLEDYIVKYKAYLDKHKIPTEERVMPSLIFKNIKSSKKVFPIPHVDPWPNNYHEWKDISGERLKGRETLENIVNGKFPVFAQGIHDVWHFLKFAQYPEYTKILREKFAVLVQGKLTQPILSRASYAMELLTLADRKKLPLITSQIIIKNPTKQTTVEDFSSAINLLSTEQVLERAKFWIKEYRNNLIHYSPGVIEPNERKMHANYIQNPGPKIFLDSFIEKFNKERSTLPVEMGYESSMAFMDTRLETLLDLYHNKMDTVTFLYKRDNNSGPPDVLAIIKLQIARMEYAQWKSASEIDLNQWTKDTLNPTVDLSSPTMKFIKDSFGENSYTYNLFQDPVNKYN